MTTKKVISNEYVTLPTYNKSAADDFENIPNFKLPLNESSTIEKILRQKVELLVLSNFFLCRHVFKRLSAAEASESVYMRERVNVR